VDALVQRKACREIGGLFLFVRASLPILFLAFDAVTHARDFPITGFSFGSSQT
jgi:hypothetical protein